MRTLAVSFMCLTACFKHAPSKGGGEISPARAERAATRSPNPYDIDVPPGYRIELVAEKLTFPTGIALGPKGERYVVESGYSYGEVFTKPRLVEVKDGGEVTEIATGDGAPWNGVAYHDGALYVAQGGEVDGGRVVRFTLDGKPTVLVDKLPSLGDHHTNGPVVSPDGWVYFGQGTMTNSGIVGEDDALFGWLDRHPDLHDVPCKDVKLAGLSFKSKDARKGHSGDVETGAYHAFATTGPAGEVIKGSVPCNGAVMRVKATGGPVELVAWGFRNPFGLALAPDGQLYVDDNGYDTRGSRPVFGSADMMWRVEPGHWYGWPDFSEGRPLTLEWYAEDKGAPKGFVLADHLEQPPEPALYFGVHSSANGFDFSRSDAFGYKGSAFVALFGDMAPTTGKVIAPVGFKIVRADPRTGEIEDFARNHGDDPGPASKLNTRGLERPVAARFDADGGALYVVDFGVIRMTDKGAEPQPQTGRLWRITKERADAH
jgi:glucose/arabinose dehydrogenase